MKMKKQWLLDYIAGMKKFIDENGGDIDLMMPAKSLLPLLEDDPEIIIDKPDGKGKDHLYIRHGKNIDGKYHLELIYIY